MLINKNPAKWLFYGFIQIHFAVDKLLGQTKNVKIIGVVPARPFLQWKIFRLAGLNFGGPDPVFIYSHFLTTETGDGQGLNGKCVDIRKSTVETVFEKVFGYPLALDPRTHAGEMVRKSEINATHDGVILQGPLEPEEGFVYERLVNAADDKGYWTDLRPCIIGNDIPFVFIKKRPPEIKFANHGNTISVKTVGEVFSAAEAWQILRFCREVGLDIGELDILRDRSTGKIYIVDVAKTPHSPSDSFINLRGMLCMMKAAKSLRRQYVGAPQHGAVPVPA